VFTRENLQGLVYSSLIYMLIIYVLYQKDLEGFCFINNALGFKLFAFNLQLKVTIQ